MSAKHYLSVILFLALSICLVTNSFAKKNLHINKTDAAFEEGLQQIDKGALNGAEKTFKSILAKKPSYEKARFQLAVIFHLKKENEKALSEIIKIKHDPEVLQAIPLLTGEIFIEMNRWQNALSTWQQVPQTTPELAALRFRGLARAYEGARKPKNAANAWTGYLEAQLAPQNNILAALAENRIKANQIDFALDYCEKTKIFASYPSYRALCKAHIYLAQFKITKNADDRKKAIDLASDAHSKDKENQAVADFLEKYQ